MQLDEEIFKAVRNGYKVQIGASPDDKQNIMVIMMSDKENKYHSKYELTPVHFDPRYTWSIEDLYENVFSIMRSDIEKLKIDALKTKQ